MEKEFTFTIQGWEASDGIESTHDELKEYAMEALGWVEFIQDPENPEATIPNPVSYEHVVFYEKPMANFKVWLTDHLMQNARPVVQAQVDAKFDQITEVTSN